MSQSPFFTIIIVLGTVITGCLNSIFTKYQDNQCVRNCNNPDPSTHENFEQPALQTLQMFIGEMGCFIVYKLYKNKQEYRPVDNEELSLKQSIRLSIPAILDLLATTMLSLGLIYIPVSIYQMMRGSVILFVAFMSVVFLNRRITKLEWISLVIITVGIAIVGLSGLKKTEAQESLVGHHENNGLVAVGLILVLVAELCQAAQFVSEEYFLGNHPIIPLQLVYFEGFYGAVIITIALVILNFIVGSVSPGNFEQSPFNLGEALSQMVSSNAVLGSSILIMISISSFNYFGLSITYYISATARSTIDSCRTLLVWIAALVLGWESFHFLQLLGFSLLVFGTLCFNKAMDPEDWNWVPSSLKTGHRTAELDFEEPLERT